MRRWKMKGVRIERGGGEVREVRDRGKRWCVR